jgi:hypothetical protein
MNINRNTKNGGIIVMSSQETVYKYNLINKSEKEIMTIIRGLKQKIGSLKNSIESPNGDFSIEMYPLKESKIQFYRLYLGEAKKALQDIGGIYKPSKAEKRSLDFMNNVNHIAKITFSIGGFCNGSNTYVATFYGNRINFTKSDWIENKKIKVYNEAGKLLTKKTFLEGIQNIYMGEWRKYYSLERLGIMVLDGTQWNIEIEYDNEYKNIKFGGSNSYPYNFNQFQALFGIHD